MKRLLTGAVLVPFAIFIIFRAPYWLFNFTSALLAFLCFFEFTRIVRGHGIEGPLWAGYPIGAAILSNYNPVALLGVLLLALGLTQDHMKQVLLYASAVLLGCLYIFTAWRCAIDLRAIHSMWVLYALAANWVGDVAAYYTGRAFGRHKLAPVISPGKSWEGAIGSLLFSVAFGVVLAQQAQLPISIPNMVALSILVNIAGQLGDLAESALKRGAGIKDSGTLLPGHGGFLDRLDSSLFTLPVVYYAVTQSGALRFLR